MRKAIAVVACVLMPAVVSAQSRVEEFHRHLSVNGGYQGASTDFRDVVTFTEFLEQGTIESSYRVETGQQFDMAGGARLWRWLGVGAGLTRFAKMSRASVAARIPHPLFFDRAREVGVETEGLSHQEFAIHVQAMAVIPAAPNVDVTLSGGPSFFAVKQGLIRAIRYSHEYPYDRAALSGMDTIEASASTVGFNAGADVAYFFARHVGVGGVIRFSRASVDFASGDGHTVPVVVGGIHVGGGLRFRF